MNVFYAIIKIYSEVINFAFLHTCFVISQHKALDTETLYMYNLFMDYETEFLQFTSVFLAKLY